MLKHLTTSLFLGFFSLILLTPVMAQTALEIMQEQKRRHDTPNEFVEYQMTLHDARGNTKQRIMISYTKTDENGQTKTLIKFLKPTNIHNVGLLTWSQEESEVDNQWLYLPASGKVRRITGGGKASPFMSTDFAFEDMRPEDLKTHEYQLVGEETFNGELAWMIDALPSTAKEKKTSGYTKRRFWISQKTYLNLKIDYYDRRKKLSKTSTYGGFVDLGNGVWRSDKVSMEKHQRKTKTVLETQQRDLAKPIKDSLFATQNLKRSPRMK